MIRRAIRKVPFLHKTLVATKHLLWAKTTSKAFADYQASHQGLKLQLGAGTNVLEGWFNTDYFARANVYYVDVTKPLPFPSNCFSSAFSEHHIEHIQYTEALFMLREICRVLKPGGRILIATPDLRKYVDYYYNSEKLVKNEELQTHIKDWIYSGFYKATHYIPVGQYTDAHFLNDIFFNYEHRFIFDKQSLADLLNHAGFINVEAATMKDHVYAEFANVYSHTGEVDNLLTLCLFAQKPNP